MARRRRAPCKVPRKRERAPGDALRPAGGAPTGLGFADGSAVTSSSAPPGCCLTISSIAFISAIAARDFGTDVVMSLRRPLSRSIGYFDEPDDSMRRYASRCGIGLFGPFAMSS